MSGSIPVSSSIEADADPSVSSRPPSVSVSPGRRAWQRFRRNRLAVAPMTRITATADGLATDTRKLWLELTWAL